MQIDANFEQMFGKSELPQFFPMGLSMFPVFVNNEIIRAAMEKAKERKQWVLVFCLGTKPCYYKFWGSIQAAEQAGLPYLIVDAGQHYDDRLTYGKQEFNLRDRVACELGIRGDLAIKSAELMVKTRWLARFLKQGWPSVTAVPVVLGDTILTSMIPPAWMFSRGEKAIQNEAGLRSMAPRSMRSLIDRGLDGFIESQLNGSWELMRNEPMPEQYDTYTSAAGSGFHFAPLEINREHLLREGYPSDRIWVIGGVVADALELKRKQKAEKSIFEEYPKLAKGRWLRVDIHRRENLTPRRFRSIVGAIVELVEQGMPICFIEMNATRHAIEVYGLKNELMKLKDRPNFLYTEVWPQYSHVVEFFESEHCFSVLTDSGGVQEEMNLLGKPCLTCRFNTDRPETVKDAGSNLLVPPVDADFVAAMVNRLYNSPALYRRMAKAPRLYGSRVGEKLIATVKELMEKGEHPFVWAHEAQGFWKEGQDNIEYLKF